MIAKSAATIETDKTSYSVSDNRPIIKGRRETKTTIMPLRKSKIKVRAAAVLPKQRYTLVNPAFLLPKSLMSLPEIRKVAMIAEFKLPMI